MIFNQIQQQKGGAKKVKYPTTRILGEADDYEGKQTETLKQATTKKSIRHKGYLSAGTYQQKQRPLSEQITVFGNKQHMFSKSSNQGSSCFAVGNGGSSQNKKKQLNNNRMSK